MKNISLLLAALVLLGAAGCGANTGETTVPTTAAADPAEPAVYFINMDTDLGEAWQTLASAYEAGTGISVRVKTVDALPETLVGVDAPVLIGCTDAAWLEKMEGQLLDLSGTEVYNCMTTEKYNWTDTRGHPTAIAYRREAYGLLVSHTLLEQAGHSVEELMDYGMLAMIAADIHSRSEKLGFDAFAPMSAHEASVLAEQLANAALYYEFQDNSVAETVSGSYLAAGRNFLDVLNVGIAEDDTALAAFNRGETVFLPVSTSDLAQLENVDNVTMLPLYCGIENEETQGLWECPVSRWAVNANAPQVCIEAALDFLNWVVTAEAGTTMLAGYQSRQLFLDVPAAEEETVTVEWIPGRIAIPAGWLESTADVMTGYLTGENDWNAVKETFTAGWKND